MIMLLDLNTLPLTGATNLWMRRAQLILSNSVTNLKTIKVPIYFILKVLFLKLIAIF